MTELIIRYAEPKAGEADSVVRPMEVMGELVRCKNCFMHDECEARKWYGENGFCSIGAKMKGGTK